jgi:hypothetical protein
VLEKSSDGPLQFGQTRETLHGLFDGVDDAASMRIRIGAFRDLFPSVPEPPPDSDENSWRAKCLGEDLANGTVAQRGRQSAPRHLEDAHRGGVPGRYRRVGVEPHGGLDVDAFTRA